jgi:hypothetical protein
MQERITAELKELDRKVNKALKTGLLAHQAFFQRVEKLKGHYVATYTLYIPLFNAKDAELIRNDGE